MLAWPGAGEAAEVDDAAGSLHGRMGGGYIDSAWVHGGDNYSAWVHGNISERMSTWKETGTA